MLQRWFGAMVAGWATMPKRVRGACIASVLLSCAALPAVPLAGYLVCYAIMGIRRNRWQVTAVLSVALLLTGVGSFVGLHLLERVSYRLGRGKHVAGLAGALNTYAFRHRTLPADLQEIEATGLMGSAPYHLPSSGWEVSRYTGRRPHYLPVARWDGHTRFIVAVEAWTCRTGDGRGYVVLGDTSGHYASNAELERLLSADDRVRERNGEAARWRFVAWRGPEGHP
jgi:hypothetical protein